MKSTFRKASYHCGNSEDLYTCRSLIAEIAVTLLRGVEKTNEAIHILESGECLRCVVIY